MRESSYDTGKYCCIEQVLLTNQPDAPVLNQHYAGNAVAVGLKLEQT